MTIDPESRVMLHPDGYIEVTLIGEEPADSLDVLANRSRNLVDEHGPMSILIDARNGRIRRDARSFAILLGLGRVPKLRHLYILISDDPHNTEGAQRSSLIVSLISTALGLHPIYVDDEAEARAKAVAE